MLLPPFPQTSSSSLTLVLFLNVLLLNLETSSSTSPPIATSPPSPSRSVPSLDGSSKEPIFAIADEDVLIDCRVDHIANYTLVWRYLSPTAKVDDSAEIIAAGMVRVTSDVRFDVLHVDGESFTLLFILLSVCQ